MKDPIGEKGRNQALAGFLALEIYRLCATNPAFLGDLWPRIASWGMTHTLPYTRCTLAGFFFLCRPRQAP
ncbi:MAG: hypothetical protein R6U40_06855 [Desulfobacterales bacterium]